MLADGLLITEEIYRQALNIAKSAIMEITDYLDALYKKRASEEQETSR